MGFITLLYPRTLRRNHAHWKGCNNSDIFYINIKLAITKGITGSILFDEIKILGGFVFNSKSRSMSSFVQEQDFQSSLSDTINDKDKEEVSYKNQLMYRTFDNQLFILEYFSNSGVLNSTTQN